MKLRISTHTLTWSVTKDFLRYAIGKIISTHTLTWSVTRYTNTKYHANQYFNSHAHVERDRTWEDFDFTLNISTHTLTWSVTDYVGRISPCMYDFNSHAHVERDVTTISSALKNGNFNSHAHVERDCYWKIFLTNTPWFQLTRSRGAWLKIWKSRRRSLAFQLTRSRGAWPLKFCSENMHKNFNSHAHVERD